MHRASIWLQEKGWIVPYGSSEGRKKEYFITLQGKQIAEKELCRLNELIIAEKELCRLNELINVATKIVGGTL